MRTHRHGQGRRGAEARRWGIGPPGRALTDDEHAQGDKVELGGGRLSRGPADMPDMTDMPDMAAAVAAALGGLGGGRHVHEGAATLAAAKIRLAGRRRWLVGFAASPRLLVRERAQTRGRQTQCSSGGVEMANVDCATSAFACHVPRAESGSVGPGQAVG